MTQRCRCCKREKSWRFDRIDPSGKKVFAHARGRRWYGSQARPICNACAARTWIVQRKTPLWLQQWREKRMVLNVGTM